MAVSPVNITRISENFQTSLVLDSVRRSQRALFLSQTRIATGRQFVAPSEDPIAAARSLDLSQALQRQQQFRDNAQYGENILSAADGALSEIADLLIQASSAASRNVSNLTSAAERQAESEAVAAIRRQLQVVGNRQFDGRYIFAGRNTLSQPFVDGPAGIAFVGDTGELQTRLSEDLVSPVTMPGSEIFGALSSRITTDVNLTPVLTDSTRLEDITGATGSPIQTGILVFNEVGGAGVFKVDLSAADTIGDVVNAIKDPRKNKINGSSAKALGRRGSRNGKHFTYSDPVPNDAAGAAGARVTATLTDTGIKIQPAGFAVSVTDASAGATASGLGILTQTPTNATIIGGKLVPRITRLTPIEALAQGAGIDIAGGLVITNGPRSAVIDLSAATTVQDIINAINNAGVFVAARINDAGTGIDVFNQASGTSLSIGENGGTTAADLGIRTFSAATPLSSLNFGLGVSTVQGQDDLRITAGDGSTVDVNLDGAVTVGDAIDLINAAALAASVNITASFTDTGNGIQIQDGAGGAGDLAVSRLNLSNAAEDLGLLQGTFSDGTLVGADVHPTRTEGIFGALIDLENALRNDDTRGIGLAGQRLDQLRDDVTRMHGIVGARAQAMSANRLQAEDAAQSTEIFLSQVRDLDYTEAVTKLQAATTQFEAGLRTSAAITRLSLMDFLQ
ncbi:MAG: flagellar hook-associated protein FlgL [Planctomycetota bacterium]